MDAYWRAANYLSVGQLYLRDNPLLRELIMKTSPLAGQPADASILVNVPRLVTAYYTEVPDPSVPEDIYKIYAESFWGADHLHRILEEAQKIVSDALAASPQLTALPSGTKLTENPS